jgi:hypothetical protein
MAKQGTPAEFLLNVAAATIQKRWRVLRQSGIASSSVPDLRTAFAYLTGLANAEAEDRSASIRRNPYSWEGSSHKDTTLEDISEWLAYTMTLVVLGIGGLFEFNGDESGIRDILRIIFLVPILFPILVRLLRGLVINQSGLDAPLTVEGLRSDRLTILAVLSESSADALSGDRGERSQSDEELEVDSALPAPPGITEMVLEAAPSDVFKNIRSHLLSVRRYHNIVLWALIVAFMTFFGVSIWKLISSSKGIGDYVQAFGSAGVGGMLFWFGQRTLWAQRVSQLSLAIFESYVAEVGESLAEIPQDATPAERRKIRSEVWKGFRNGLNQLWLDEQSRLARETDSAKRGAKKNTPAE